MSALRELERYIQENEVTLHSLNQSSLKRNPLASISNHSLQKQSPALSLNQSAVSRHELVVRDCSAEKELEHFISKLKQMQQFRISQLQKVHALFNHDMELENQSDITVRTKEEIDLLNDEDDFEAFLLGETFVDENASQATTEGKRGEETSLHNTIHTKQTTSTVHINNNENNSKMKSSNTCTADNTDSSVQNVEDSLLLTEDVILQLRQSRLDRSSRLKAISSSLQAIGLGQTQSKSSSVSNNLQTSVINETRNLSNVSKKVPDYHKVLQLPPSLAINTHDTQEMHVPAASYQHRIGGISSSSQSDDDKLPPPPPPILPLPSKSQSSISSLIPHRKENNLKTSTRVDVIGHSSTMSSERFKSHEEAVSSAEGLTLQAIAEGGLYLPADPALTHEPLDCNNLQTRFPESGRDETTSTRRRAGKLTGFSTVAGKTFLVDNTRRLYVESLLLGRSSGSIDGGGGSGGVNGGGDSDSDNEEERRCDFDNLFQARDLSISTIAQESGEEGSGSELSGTEARSILPESSKNGIGFGRRYRGKNRVESLDGVDLFRNKPPLPAAHSAAAVVITDDTARSSSSGGICHITANQRLVSCDSIYDKSEGHEHIFDYMEALESPGRPTIRHRSATKSMSGGKLVLTKPGGAENKQSTPERVKVNPEGAFNSPTPKTPTFSPIFS